MTEIVLKAGQVWRPTRGEPRLNRRVASIYTTMGEILWRHELPCRAYRVSAEDRFLAWISRTQAKLVEGGDE